jgi:hypothetical protein
MGSPAGDALRTTRENQIKNKNYKGKTIKK